MATIFKLDSKSFNKTLENYAVTFKKDLANECNRRAANICARAIKNTKRANVDRIIRDMKATETVKASYVKETKRRGQYVALGKGGKTTQGELTVGYMGKSEGFAIANWRLKRGKTKGFYRRFPNKFAGPGRGKRGGTASAFYERFVRRAKSSSAYIAAGWLKAYNSFKEVVVGKVIKPDKEMRFFAKIIGSAARGKGLPAASGGETVKAIFFNTADGVNKIGEDALVSAIKEEEVDMIKYMADRMQSDFNKLK